MKRYNIKKVIFTGLALAVCLQGLTACGSGSNDSNKYQSDGNSVEDALNSQMAKEDAEKETETTEADTEYVPETLVVPPSEQDDGEAAFEILDKESAQALFGGNGNSEDSSTEATTEATTESGVTSIEDAKTDVDIDLTVMDSNMVYSTVYQMMADAPTYVGQTVRMEGTYYSSYDEATDTRYHFLIIQDATACCQQGMEFVWDDGSHVFPDEYPEDGTEAVVVGTFETYKENPDDVYEYIRLNNASFEVVEEVNN